MLKEQGKLSAAMFLYSAWYQLFLRPGPSSTQKCAGHVTKAGGVDEKEVKKSNMKGQRDREDEEKDKDEEVVAVALEDKDISHGEIKGKDPL
jgi:hypothetical protein